MVREPEGGLPADDDPQTFGEAETPDTYGGGANANGATPTPAADHWIEGEPMDPARTPGEPMTPIAGTPLPPGQAVLVSGPTGGGRSMLAEVLHYDSARAGVPSAYFGAEITRDEYDARAAEIASRRGDALTPELREALQLARYLDLPEAITRAWTDPAAIVARYRWITLDPLSHVASALGLDFDSNTEYARFHDTLVGPLTRAGVTVLTADNIGHADDAKTRPKGASAKGDRADVSLSCARAANPPGLAIKAAKVRSVRAGIARGDEWLFVHDTLRIVSRERDQTDRPRTFRPTAFMAKISAALERDPGLSKRAIRVAVGGKSETVDLALELLVSEGYVRVETDGRGGHHHPVRPYSEPTVPTVTRPCPDRDPDTLPIDRDPVTPPLKGGTVTVTGENGDKPTNRDPLAADALRHSEGPETRNP
jgi:hypothetical protein